VGQIGSVYKQPETEVDDSCHKWRVPSKWKGVQKGTKGINKGSKGDQQGEQGENAPFIYVTVMYMQKND
jgi:hypothetical protein